MCTGLVRLPGYPSPLSPARARGLVGALLLSFSACQVPADVVATFVVNGDGTVTYTYEVDNTAGAFDVAAWSLEFPFATPDWDPLDVPSGGGVGVPNATWFAAAGIPVGGLSAQDFVSLDATGDVLLGTTLGGFSFTSAYLPGLVDYLEFSALGDSVSGQVLGPALLPPPAVPEAGGWLGGAVAVGFAAGVMGRRWRGARRPAGV